MSQFQAIACGRDEMSEADRSRHVALLSRLQSRLERVSELPDGYAGYLPPSEAGAAIEWIGFERQCCPFLAFALEFEPGEEAAWLRVTGPEGASGLIAGIFGRQPEAEGGCRGGEANCSC